jgi:hypothetical protein
VTLLVVISSLIDCAVAEIRGLLASSLVVAVGWLFIWRTEQEMESSFTGPEGHRPWLQATGRFVIAAGLFGMILSLMALI